MTEWPVHARIDGPIVMIGFGSIGKGTLPLIERHFSYDKSRFVVIDPEDKDRKPARRARHPLHPPGGDQGQLPPPADAAADRGRRPGLLRQPVGRHLLARHHGVLPRDRRALHRHRGRALARASTSTQAGTGGALELRAARDDARRAPQEARRHHRRVLLRRQSRHGVVVRQAGAAQRRHRPRPQVQGAEDPRGMGQAGARRPASRASTSPSATPSAPSSPKPMDVFVNTWSVEGFISEGLQPAELGWGTHEKWMPANAHKHKTGCRRGDLPDCSPAPIRACAHGRRRRRRNTASWSRTTSRSRSPTTSRCATAARLVYRPTCHYAYHPCNDAVLSLHEMFGQAGKRQAEHPHSRRARDRRRHRRTRRAALRPQEERLLVRLAAFDRRDARARALSERDRPAGDLRRARRHGVGAGESEGRHRREPTRWISAAASKCRCLISAR